MVLRKSAEVATGGYVPGYDREPEIRRAVEVAEARGWRQPPLHIEGNRLAPFDRVMAKVVSEQVDALRRLIAAETDAQLRLKDASELVVKARGELSAVLDELSPPKDEVGSERP